MLFSWLINLTRRSRAPDSALANALYSQGEAAHRAGRHREAAAHLLGAINANPRVAEYHYELGRVMRSLAEPERAITCFRAAIGVDARHRDAHIDIASVMLGLGNPAAAEQAARAALQIDPASVPAHVNLGGALEEQGRFGEAAESYRAALAIQADFVPALCNLSTICLQLGEVDEAARHAEHAVRIAPQDAVVHLRRASVLLEMRRPHDAAESFREALRLQPACVQARTGVGYALDIQGDLDGALAQYQLALETDPADVQAHLNRATIRLAREDYVLGWEEYEWRLRSASHAALYARFNHPLWDGAPLAGRRVLIYGEQGLGDEIMFASCIPEAIAQAAHCVIDCEPRLAGMFRRSFPQATVHAGKQTDAVDWLADAGDIDVRIPSGSLPLRLRRSPDSFPRHQGYLRADPERIAVWRERLRQLGPGLKVGLSWRGGVPQTGRGSRSIPLADLLPVLRVAGATFVNLQYNRGGGELATLRERHEVEILDWPQAVDDYEDTAALACALDLTVSVCTALVDLCGALGRPVWVLAPVRSDFRYGLSGETMRWYPSVRMFRQSTYGDWAPVIASVAEALKKKAAG